MGTAGLRLLSASSTATACPASANQDEHLDGSLPQGSALRYPRHTLSASSSSTALPASASQDDLLQDASPLFASLYSTCSTWPRASTAALGVANADLDARQTPEEPHPMTIRPLVGVPQQIKLWNVDSPKTARVRRDVSNLAAMRQIHRTRPVMS